MRIIDLQFSLFHFSVDNEWVNLLLGCVVAQKTIRVEVACLPILL